MTETRELNGRAFSILSGKVEPPDIYSAHMVYRLKRLKEEGNTLLQRLREAEEQSAQWRQRLVEIRGIAANYELDLADWLSREADAEKPTKSNMVQIFPPTEKSGVVP